MLRVIGFLLILGLAACAAHQRESDIRVAGVALENGSASTALKIAEDRLKQNPDDVAALGVQGDAEFMTGRLAQAEASYRRALELSRRDRRALLGLGRILLDSDPRGAESYFREALRYYPSDGDAMTNLGVALDAQGDHAGAQELYRQVIARNPEASSAVADLGLSLALTGKTAEALQYLEPMARQPGSSSRVRGDAAFALALAGRMAEAQALLRSYMTDAQSRAALRRYEEIARQMHGTAAR